ncbi:glycerophosphodiester phosphodiesterase family protein [Candidatus Hecatella orcuttiae]|jgi:glycerophosphoryl diester phosphodiesterase|uniref:glycerophosphodiester phosphodiesterase family protein n=1 Tax=Candidatus Hecatella orcuttiae TaxID=1935119 RepID=UPI002867E187|nr:glycerophosphodiester phosphodiesterase family protein [Candidatus Hecatella orcuttiae]
MLKVLCIAHRGASAYEPENTLAAVEAAIALKADMVEVDLRLSKDGFPVVVHDRTVDRTTDGSGPVGNLTLDQLKKLDAGGGARIPTLEEVVSAVKDKAGLVVELKEKGLEKKVLESLKPLRSRVMVTSFFHTALKKVKELDPQVETGIIIKSEPLQISQLILQAKANAVFPDYRYVTATMVKEAHRNGFAIIPWTVDEIGEAQRLVRMGVDGIVTNRPNLFSADPSKLHRAWRVFLAGPIQGMEADQGYRETLKRILREKSFEVVDPWEREKFYYPQSQEGVKGLIRRDLMDIDRCEFFLAFLPRLSMGVAMELFHAKKKGKETFVLTSLKELSPWVAAHADRVFRTFDELETYLAELR